MPIYKQIRKEKGLTQKEICRDFTTRVTLSNIENGKHVPNLFLIEYLRFGICTEDKEMVNRGIEILKLSEEKEQLAKLELECKRYFEGGK
ncbi:helix-turn-helix domain-containing protein [Pilibacter termitis]|nr:helix-turn-helix transcriptional regulator [Pilibacter termitis]